MKRDGLLPIYGGLLTFADGAKADPFVQLTVLKQQVSGSMDPTRL